MGNLKTKLNFFKNKTLIIAAAVLIVVLSFGFVSAYKKLSQNPQGPLPSQTYPEDFPGYGSDEERDFGVGKSFVNPLPKGSRMENDVLRAPKDSSINYQIWFKGKIDKNPGVSKADIMLLIDRSNSMKSRVDQGSLPENCLFGKDPEGFNRDDSKLCWSIWAAKDFIDMTADPRGDLRVGYVTYGADEFTKNDENAQYFKSLADMKNPDNRKIIKWDWLDQINFHPNTVSGTAMGKATNFALEELEKNGRKAADVKKYIILLTDGVGNQNPLMTGSASWRKTPSDAWPTGWPNNGWIACRECPFGKKKDGVTCLNPPNDPSSPLYLSPPYDSPPLPKDIVDCSIDSSKTSIVTEGYKPFRTIDVGNYADSPVGKAVARNILIPTIGFGSGDNINMNPGLLDKIYQTTFNDTSKNAYINNKPENIQAAFRDIIIGIFGDQAALIHFEETLPAGVDINIPSGIKIEHTVKNKDFCPSADNDYYCRKPYTINQGANQDDNIIVAKDSGSGRVVLKFDLVPSHYDSVIPFENERFFVNLTANTANAQATSFDLDQNRDSDCGGSVPNVAPKSPVSLVKWSWNFPLASGKAREPVITPTSKLCVALRPAQYTGDVYGATINNYLFPYIDVLVSGGSITPGTQAVWELPNYNFSATSFSDFSNYQNYLDSQIDDLIQKAKITDISTALQLPVDTNINPEGGIFYVRGNPALNGTVSIPMGKGRRTIIVEGNLDINQEIVKKNNESTAAIIVLGDVVTIGDAKSVQAGIITPGFHSNAGLIRIVSTNNYLDILGFLVGKRINLKSLATSDTQSINYDSNLAKFPPPGIAKLSLPLYQEVAP